MLLSLVFPSVLVTTAHGATIVVHPATDALADAIAMAADGDVLMLDPGEYDPVVISGGKTLTIEGSAVGESVLGGVWVTGGSVTMRGVILADASEGLKVEAADVVVERSVIRDSGSWRDAAVTVQAGAQVTLIDVVAEQIRGPLGAIEVTGQGALSMQGVEIRGCEGRFAGAIYADGASADLERVSITDCLGEDGGGMAALSGTVSLSDVRIADTAAVRGGGLFIKDAEVTAADVIFSGNSASSGGHIYVGRGSMDWSRGVLGMGSAETGGGVSVVGGDVTIRNVLWHRLSAVSGGGLSAVGGETTISHSVLSTVEADVGAAIAASGGAVWIDGSILVDAVGAEAIASTDVRAVSVRDSMFWDNPEGDWLGSVASTGGVRGDPLFTDTAAGDWTLRAGSPGLDAVAGLDHDGTAADMGLFGGEHAEVLPDNDGDGFVAGRDCDDSDALVNESEPEAWYDGIDADCDGASDFDADGDGFDSESRVGGGDCDDFSADIHPDAEEVADKVDSNCDGVDLVDADGDGFGYDADCSDEDPSIYPGAEEHWYDGIDGDCAGDDDYDQDGDGHVAARYAGADEAGDCDDMDPFVSPSAPEIAGDGIDNDCRDGDAAMPESDSGITELIGDDGAQPAEEAAPYERPDSLMTSAGCSAGGGLPAWSLAGLAFLMTLCRRRRSC